MSPAPSSSNIDIGGESQMPPRDPSSPRLTSQDFRPTHVIKVTLLQIDFDSCPTLAARQLVPICGVVDDAVSQQPSTILRIASARALSLRQGDVIRIISQQNGQTVFVGTLGCDLNVASAQPYTLALLQDGQIYPAKPSPANPFVVENFELLSFGILESGSYG